MKKTHLKIPLPGDRYLLIPATRPKPSMEVTMSMSDGMKAAMRGMSRHLYAIKTREQLIAQGYDERTAHRMAEMRAREFIL